MWGKLRRVSTTVKLEPGDCRVSHTCIQLLGLNQVIFSRIEWPSGTSAHYAFRTDIALGSALRQGSREGVGEGFAQIGKIRKDEEQPAGAEYVARVLPCA